jgi:carboxylesterase type B
MWYNVSSIIGCGSASSEATSVLSCMQSTNSSAILAALGSQAFTPTIDHTVVFADYPVRSQAGKFIKKPILMGNNDNEAGIFRISSLGQGQNFPQSHWDQFNLNRFICPCAARANISVFNHVPTWRYRWFGVFPNTNLTTYPDSGAYHGSEMAIVFGTPPAGKGIQPNSPQEVALMNYIRGAWAAFAKDPEKGLSNYQGGWPAYDPTKNTLVRLGFNETTGTNLALPHLYDAVCGTIFSVDGVISNGTGTSGSTGSTTSAKPSSANAIAVSSRLMISVFVTAALIWL